VESEEELSKSGGLIAAAYFDKTSKVYLQVSGTLVGILAIVVGFVMRGALLGALKKVMLTGK